MIPKVQIRLCRSTTARVYDIQLPPGAGPLPRTPITAGGLQELCRKMHNEVRGWDHNSKCLVKPLLHATWEVLADHTFLHGQDGDRWCRIMKMKSNIVLSNGQVMIRENTIVAQSTVFS